MAAKVRLVVKGLVQGVSFRDFIQDKALWLGLTGFVRNLPDRRVEIVAEGDEGALERLAAWARRGPPMAQVVEVEVTYSESGGSYTRFEVG